MNSKEELLSQKFIKINFYKKMILLSAKEERIDYINEIKKLVMQIETIIDSYTRNNSLNKDEAKAVFSYRTREFTMSELSKYNGVGDNHAYIAVNGTVYDITGERLLNQILAEGLTAGTDLSNQFNSGKLSKQLLSDVRIVGVLRQ